MLNKIEYVLLLCFITISLLRHCCLICLRLEYKHFDVVISDIIKGNRRHAGVV